MRKAISKIGEVGGVVGVAVLAMSSLTAIFTAGYLIHPSAGLGAVGLLVWIELVRNRGGDQQ